MTGEGTVRSLKKIEEQSGTRVRRRTEAKK